MEKKKEKDEKKFPKPNKQPKKDNQNHENGSLIRPREDLEKDNYKED